MHGQHSSKKPSSSPPPALYLPSDVTIQCPSCSHTYLMRVYLGSRLRFRVLGLWKTTEKRGLRDRLKVPFLTALAALVA